MVKDIIKYNYYFKIFNLPLFLIFFFFLATNIHKKWLSSVVDNFNIQSTGNRNDRQQPFWICYQADNQQKQQTFKHLCLSFHIFNFLCFYNRNPAPDKECAGGSGGALSESLPCGNGIPEGGEMLNMYMRHAPCCLHLRCLEECRRWSFSGEES